MSEDVDDGGGVDEAVNENKLVDSKGWVKFKIKGAWMWKLKFSVKKIKLCHLILYFKAVRLVKFQNILNEDCPSRFTL